MMDKTVANDYRTQAKWLEIAAILLELLAIALVISWAWHSQTNVILASICVLAFVGFEISRIYTVPMLVNAVKHRHYGIIALGHILVFATLLILFAATVFENINKSEESVQTRLANSATIKAVELEIEQTRDRIQSLAGFSNPEKAHAEVAQLQADKQALLDRAEGLRKKIHDLLNNVPKNQQGHGAGKTLNHLTANCTAENWYAKTYCQEVKTLQAELNALSPDAIGTATYTAKYDEYTGLQTHLAELMKQRATLLNTQGEGITASAYRPEDVFLSEVLGITPQKASFVKWLFFSAVLDLLGLGLRFLASMARYRANGWLDELALKREYARKINAIITLYGVDGVQQMFNQQPALALPNANVGGAQPQQQATPNTKPASITAQATEQPPELSENKQGFVGFVPPNTQIEPPKDNAQNDNKTFQPVTWATNADTRFVNTTDVYTTSVITNLVNTPESDTTTPDTTSVKDTTVVNTNHVNTTVVGDVGECPTCGTQFTRRNKRHKYCSEACRITAHGFKDKQTLLFSLNNKAKAEA